MNMRADIKKWYFNTHKQLLPRIMGLFTNTTTVAAAAAAAAAATNYLVRYGELA